MSFQSFDTYGNESLFAARAAAEDLAIGEGNIKWLTLISGVDRGKTHLAVAVCRAWLERGFPARYAFLPKLLNELRAGYEDQAVPYQARLDLFCRVDLLVLDDLGVEKPSEWAQEQIQTIVHERGMAGLPLLVTSNRALDDLPIDPLGRIASRLQRESWCKVLVLDAPEHRLV